MCRILDTSVIKRSQCSFVISLDVLNDSCFLVIKFLLCGMYRFIVRLCIIWLRTTQMINSISKFNCVCQNIINETLKNCKDWWVIIIIIIIIKKYNIIK